MNSRLIQINPEDLPNLDDDWRNRLIDKGVSQDGEWREFRYESSSGKEYVVKLGYDIEQHLIGSCTCPGNISKSHKVCKHLYAACLYSGVEEKAIVAEFIGETKEEDTLATKKETVVENKEDSHLSVWSKFNRPPAHALKLITGGRLSGMSDISPQWRYYALTEAFGPCGVGWKFIIKRTWTEPGADGAMFAFAEIELYVKIDGEWSEPIPGIGGSMLIAKESKGMFNSDEAHKMSVTDALGTAAKMIGVGADIYMGRWDGSKYKDENVDGSTADWLEACKDASNELSLEDFRKWWDENKDAINDDCGRVGAAKIYDEYKKLGKAKAANDNS